MHSNIKGIFYALAFLVALSSAEAQQNLLKSGPMLGPVTLRTATLWAQTSKEAKVEFRYRLKDSKDNFSTTESIMTNHSNAFIATAIASLLTPGKRYEYQLVINEEVVKTAYPTTFTAQTLWAYRMDAPDFTFATGSCLYINETEFDRPGKSYGGEYEILSNMYKSKPDFMVWLGDNTYLREGDYDSKAGIYHRYTHTRSVPELQPFLGSVAQYATWDDHDYGPNDSDWTYPLKNYTLEAFKNFWPNEAYGAGHTEAVTSSFVWNDCQFFMLDDRWYRTVETDNGTILGEQQKYWLKEALLNSKATFKFVCVGGQFLSNAAIFENFANFKEERQEIIDYIDDKNIKGVVFLTGDRHHTEITKLVTAKGNTIYDATVSAITSTTYDHSAEKNTLRVPGSMISERNYGVFNVSGSKEKRALNAKFFNTVGKQLYEYNFTF